MSYGIPVYRCVQNPLEFVLIFPGAYHSEFSCGFNCTEAVCFAPLDWLPHGQSVVELYSEYCQKTSLSHDKLLFRAAMAATHAQWEIWTAKRISTYNKDGILMKALKARIRLEDIRAKHFRSLSRSRMPDENVAATKMECSICRYDLFLSAIGCSCTPRRYTCLHHAKQLCSCAWEAKCYFFRYESSELNLLVEALKGNLIAMHSWAKKAQPATDSIVSKDALQNGNITHSDGACAINGIAVNKNVGSVLNIDHGDNEELNVGSCEQNKAATCKFASDSSQQNVIHHSDSREKDFKDEEFPDHLNLFTTSVLFGTLKDAENWVMRRGMEAHLYLVVQHKQPGRVYIGCKETETWNSRKTKKTKCPFQIVLRRQHDGRWAVTSIKDRLWHNHLVGEHQSFYTSTSKLSQRNFDFVAKYKDANSRPKVILQRWQKENTKSKSTLKHIYNDGQKILMTENGNLIPIQDFFKLLIENDYVFEHDTDPETNRLNHVLIAHPKSLELVFLFPYVIYIDATYCMNKYKLLEVSGITPTEQNYHVAFIWLKDEKYPSFLWALNQLKRLFANCDGPKVIVTDREEAMMNALDIVFPEAKHLLCRRHISKDIRNWQVRKWKTKHYMDTIERRWDQIVFSSTEELYEENVARFFETYRKKTNFLEYIRTWWLPQRHRFVRAWTRQYMHFGALSINRVNNIYSQLKNYSGSDNMNFHAGFEKIHETIEGQLNIIRSELEKSRNVVSPAARKYKVFHNIANKCAHLAIEIMDTDCRRVLHHDECTHELINTHGLPCGCMIQQMARERRAVDPMDVQFFWRTLSHEASSVPNYTERATGHDLFDIAASAIRWEGSNSTLRMLAIGNKQHDHKIKAIDPRPRNLH